MTVRSCVGVNRYAPGTHPGAVGGKGVWKPRPENFPRKKSGPIEKPKPFQEF